MKLAAASLNQTPIDWENNKKNIFEAITKAKNEGIDLLCLPELCITGYGCEDLFLHPWLTDKALDILFEILPDTKGISTILGLPFHYQNSIYNVVCLIDNGKIIGFQAKQHLPNDGVHYEPRWFSPWEPERIESIDIDGISYPFGDKIYQIGNKKIGFEICEDAWVTNRPACRLGEQKVDIILNPSASHFSFHKSKIREDKTIDASKEFNCTYMFANQLGNEAGKIIYDGDAIIAHKGVLAANTKLFSFSNLALTTCEIDYKTDKITRKSIISKTDCKEEQFVAATTLGLFDYLRKSKSNGFIISLSGGADSSTCLVLTAEMIKRGVKALGVKAFLNKIGLDSNLFTNSKEITKQLIRTAYQATENSSPQTLAAAKMLAESVNASFYHWTIDDEVNHAREIIESVINRKLSWSTDDIALQNIQARSRSPIIWMLANLENSLLITTSNRSEGSVGYATMDGDTSGSLAPIAGVDKPFIIEWLKWAEKELGFAGLNKVNRLTPTAELRPSEQTQSDEEDLMPYKVLNQIERLFVHKRSSPKMIHQELMKSLPKKLAATYVVKFFQLWSRNQWKRERLAPSFHLDDYNIDPRSWFRYPILSGGFKNELVELTKLAR